MKNRIMVRHDGNTIPRGKRIFLNIFLCLLISTLILLAFWGLYSITKAVIFFDPWEDWIYVVADEYEIINCHSGSVVLHKINGVGTILDACIVSFSYNDSYILMKRLSVSEWDDSVAFDEYHKANEEKIEFFIFCFDDENLYGPYTTEEFNKKCNEINVGETPEWIETSAKPKGAYGSSIYDSWKYEKHLKKLSKD